MSGASKAVSTDDTLLRIQRFGDCWEDAHFTLGYSPVPDPTVPGGVGGIFVTALEITERIETERKVQEAQTALRSANQALEAEQAFYAICSSTLPALWRCCGDPTTALNWRTTPIPG